MFLQLMLLAIELTNEDEWESFRGGVKTQESWLKSQDGQGPFGRFPKFIHMEDPDR